MIRVALAGNPNVGKSVIFNNLTGSHQRIGNWPGKTVEKKEGIFRYDSEEIYVIDLPGIYSLTPYSVEELIARNYIIEERPDIVVVIIDASNIERNLYLLLQILELEVKIVVALNKTDLARSSNIHIDVKKLESMLGVPVIPMVAPKKLGMGELCRKILEVAKSERQRVRIKYSDDFEHAIHRVVKLLEGNELSKVYNARWLAIKLLEKDSEVINRVRKVAGGETILKEVDSIRRSIEEKYGDSEIAFVDERYRIIGSIVEEVVKGEKTLTVSDYLDQAFLNRYLGMPIFISILWIIFQFTFIVSTPFSDMLGDFFAFLSERLYNLTGIKHIDYLLFGDYGVLNGIGTVLSFIPLIMALYFALSLFEDFGYMARAAFLMDKVMRGLGLTGRCIIPMILGFGCNIAGVYSARIIPAEEDRIIAIITNPLMLCSARLVTFMVIVAAFWGSIAGTIILSLYVLGIGLAVLVALVLRKVVFKGLVSPFIMELPPYQMPSLKVAFVQMWIRGSLFFKKAGTIILLGLIVIGLLSTTNASTFSFTDNIEESLVSAIGRFFQPLFSPFGWDWRLIVAIIFGFIAKEIVIGATAMLYGVSEEGLSSLVALHYDPITMYAYMVFVLIYVPCVATLAAVKHETSSWKWTFFTILYEVTLAYALSLLILFMGRTLFSGV